jgi:hypothetical protein
MDMRKAKVLLVVLSVVLSAVVLGIGAAEADKSKPKPQPTEVVSLPFNKVEFVYTTRLDGSPGPSVVLDGVLHLVSQSLLSADGVPVGFTLHTDLSDAFASNVDGTGSYVAVGSDGMPAECSESAPCLPPFWTLMFRLVPQPGSGPQSSLLFTLTVNTQYDADGTLVSACVLGQEGCEVIVFVP